MSPEFIRVELCWVVGWAEIGCELSRIELKIELNCGMSSAELVLLIVNETRRIPPLRQLLAAGRNVFTEKPLCVWKVNIG